MPYGFMPDDENERLKNAPMIMPTPGSLGAPAVPANPTPIVPPPSPTPNVGFMPDHVVPDWDVEGIPGVPDPSTTPQYGFEIDPEAARGPTRMMWDRFWGTDVQDPIPLARLGTQLGGALTGATAGAEVGTAIGRGAGPLGAVAGTAIGGMAGALAGVSAGSAAPEAAMELGQMLGILRPDLRETYGLSNEELKTLVQGELLLEMGTDGAMTAARGVGRGVASLITGTRKAGRELAEHGARYGIDLLPVQVGGRPVARAFVNVMGQFPWVGGPLRNMGQAVDDQVKYAVQHLPLRIAPAFSSPAIGRQIVDDVTELSKRFDTYFDEAYGKIDQAASEAGVMIKPKLLLQSADKVLEDIAAATPIQIGKGETKSSATKALEGVKTFVESEVQTLRSQTEIGRVTAKQPFSNMRGMVHKIDEQISALVKEGISYRSPAVRQLLKLKQGATADLVTNAIAADPARATEIMSQYRELNTHFSQTMNELFETAGAKRYKAVRTGGVRGTASQSTRMPADNLARFLLRDESPQIVEEIHRLMTPDTFKNMTSNFLRNKINVAMKSSGTETFLDADTFRKSLGLNDPKSQRYAQVKKMLELSGGITIGELEQLSKIIDTVANTPMPNMSQFVARRATLGGFSAIKNAILPGALLGGAAGGITGGATGAGLGTIIAGLSVIGGGNMISRMISNPDNARKLRFVLGHEITRMSSRRAMLQLWRGTLQESARAGDITMSEMAEWLNSGSQFINEVYDDTIDHIKTEGQGNDQ